MKESWMLALGFVGQAMFAGRFGAQWWASERQGRSVVPLSFWVLSVTGGVLMLGYAVLRRDPVFILGQAGGLLIYVRNLVLIQRAAQAGSSQANR
jgi:lipid-A-disaccharide synthase-like uncharacterized protein